MNKNKILNDKKLTFTLIGFLLLISIIFTLIQTIFILKNDYDDSIKTVNDSINQIKNTRIDSISMAIWQLDNKQLDILIDGILKLPGIIYVQINENNSDVIKAGKKNNKYTIENTFNLIHKNLENTKLGTIYIQGSYEKSVDKLFKKIIEKIFIEIFKVFSIAFLLIFVVHKLIIKHLITMAKYTIDLDTKKLSIPLILDKKYSKSNPDSIDIVADAINTMRTNLINDIQKQAKYKTNLELTNKKLEEEIKIRKAIEKDALAKKERIQNQYNTIIELTTDNNLFEKTFEDALNFLLKKCILTFDADRVSFWKLQNDKKIKCLCRYLKSEDKYLETKNTIDLVKLPNFLNTVKENGVIDIMDVYTDSRIKEFNQEVMKEDNIKSLLKVSVLFHNEMYGLIYFETIEKQKMWTQDEILFVSRISDLISNLLTISEWKKAQKEILELNNSLEKTVEKRTKELKNNIHNLQITQKQLVESEKMASLGGLVAGVAHEINTPIGISLTGITHFQHITKELKKLYEKDNLSQEEFENYINISDEISDSIYNSIKRAAEQIKSFKQVAVDQSNEHIRSFNIKKYIEEILLSLHNRIKKTKHVITIHCENDITINGYPGSLSQILTNFIMNSLIHGFDKNTIGHIDIYAKKIDNNIELIYKDDGKGIEKEYINKIFDPFFTTNREGGGSGLGLNIVYNIIKNALHGNIEVYSKINEGVTYKITFPIED
ncbi:ATP-binding protein [Sulfurospirillum arcachonense]|uniref:ATP-binding protein n=1 Tax=Sulfurospirillum arcachonense TaxID=57666 RepID=UPI0004682BDB|nr:ATP-binding protein [Sulfurospirillum arcachonense]